MLFELPFYLKDFTIVNQVITLIVSLGILINSTIQLEKGKLDYVRYEESTIKEQCLRELNRYYLKILFITVVFILIGFFYALPVLIMGLAVWLVKNVIEAIRGAI